MKNTIQTIIVNRKKEVAFIMQETEKIPEMVSEDSVWSRRPGFKYQLWTCIQLCSFIFI